MTLYLTSKLEAEIDRKTAEWHDLQEDGIPLSAYLSMSTEEYKDFVEYNVVILPHDSLIILNNGKGWSVNYKNNTWIAYDKHSNRFQKGWCSYYETKEEAEKVKAILINE